MKTYLIKEGEDYATPNVYRPFFNKNFLYMKIKFHGNCLYQFNNSNDDAALNKGSGLSYGLTGIDSARLGWNGYNNSDGMISLHGYIHINGVWVKTLDNEYFIGKCPVDQEIEGTIEIKGNVAYYDFPGVGRKNVPFVNVKNRIGYVSNIFFGGQRLAPHNMNIGLEYILK